MSNQATSNLVNTLLIVLQKRLNIKKVAPNYSSIISASKSRMHKKSFLSRGIVGCKKFILWYNENCIGSSVNSIDEYSVVEKDNKNKYNVKIALRSGSSGQFSSIYQNWNKRSVSNFLKHHIPNLKCADRIKTKHSIKFENTSFISNLVYGRKLPRGTASEGNFTLCKNQHRSRIPTALGLIFIRNNLTFRTEYFESYIGWHINCFFRDWLFKFFFSLIWCCLLHLFQLNLVYYYSLRCNNNE